MSKHVETTHPQKLMGLYVNLAKALNALEEAGEDPRGWNAQAADVDGITASVRWQLDTGRYDVVQG